MNQREIKFRAWHTIQKKMYSAEEMGQDELTINPDGRGLVNISGKSTSLSQYAGEKMVLMQFTGLKDKNGKEIYEGDVVKGKNYLARIVWITDGWELIIYPKDGSQEHGGRLSTYVENYPFEVIGNIYENPELCNQSS